MTPSNEHLVHEHVAERLAVAEACSERRIADERPERRLLRRRLAEVTALRVSG